MKIALVSPGYPPARGGIEVVVAQQARALSRLGHTVEVFAQERRPEAVGTETDDAVTIHRFAVSGPHNYPVAPGLWRALAAQTAEFDVVHAHSYHTLTGLAAALRSRAPLVFSPHYHGTGHSPLRAALHRVYKPIGRTAFARAAAVVCVSQVEARLVAEHFPAAADKTFVVPNAVDTTAIRAAAPFEGEPPTVLCVGRMERYKQVERLLRAFAQLTYMAGPGEPTQLVIVGDGPDRPRLEALARERVPGGGQVRFLGRVEDGELHRWLRTCRVLCSMSEHEAFGLAPVEALTAGARVVLSDIPAHAELAATIAVSAVNGPALNGTALNGSTVNAAAVNGSAVLQSPTAGLGPVSLVGAYENDAALAARLLTALMEPSAPAIPPGLPDWDDIAARLAGIYSHIAPLRTGAAA